MRVVDRRWWARAESGDTTDEGGARKPTYVEELERRLTDQAAQLQTALADYRRSADEFDQVKARMRRDGAREVERAKRAVLAELLASAGGCNSWAVPRIEMNPWSEVNKPARAPGGKWPKYSAAELKRKLDMGLEFRTDGRG